MRKDSKFLIKKIVLFNFKVEIYYNYIDIILIHSFKSEIVVFSDEMLDFKNKYLLLCNR